MQRLRKTLMTVGALGALALGGSALADAASTSSPATQSPSTSRPAAPAVGPNGFHVNAAGKEEQPLTGDVAAKVKAAALAKVAGTVDRVETNVDSSAPYEAHIQKSDGSQVTVEVNKDYSVASVQSMGARP